MNAKCRMTNSSGSREPCRTLAAPADIRGYRRWYFRQFADGDHVTGTWGLHGSDAEVNALSLPFPWSVADAEQSGSARPSHGSVLFGERYAIDFIGVDERHRTARTRDWRTSGRPLRAYERAALDEVVPSPARRTPDVLLDTLGSFMSDVAAPAR